MLHTNNKNRISFAQFNLQKKWKLSHEKLFAKNEQFRLQKRRLRNSGWCNTVKKLPPFWTLCSLKGQHGHNSLLFVNSRHSHVKVHQIWTRCKHFSWIYFVSGSELNNQTNSFTIKVNLMTSSGLLSVFSHFGFMINKTNLMCKMSETPLWMKAF